MTSRLQTALERGDFVVTAELGPPKSADADAVRSKAKALVRSVHAANVTDNQTAVARMTPLACSVFMQEVGLEPVMQLVCRDRNRLALQSDLLGAWALGVRNIMILGGDPPKVGNHPDAKPVFDLDTVALMKVARDMRDKKIFLNGEEMKVAPAYFVGGAESPFGDQSKGDRMAAKVDAGANFVQTQPVYDVDAFADWMAIIHERGLTQRCSVIAGITPPKSSKMLESMKNIPGMSIPDAVGDRIAGAGEGARDEGIALAVETIQKVREIPGVAGVHIMAIMQEDAVPEVVEKAGIAPKD
ncbi:MAG: methylenetetrahydrofolate reductase [Actinomycetota bacterium]|nr:methylenetetrahydrofolate reductase [Actinomycetota bacterium]